MTPWRWMLPSGKHLEGHCGLRAPFPVINLMQEGLWETTLSNLITLSVVYLSNRAASAPQGKLLYELVCFEWQLVIINSLVTFSHLRLFYRDTDNILLLLCLAYVSCMSLLFLFAKSKLPNNATLKERLAFFHLQLRPSTLTLTLSPERWSRDTHSALQRAAC